MHGIRNRDVITTLQTTVSTTTFSPGITQSTGLQHLDILSRYSRFYIITEHFSPIINNLDRYISPLWIPIGLIGCILCIIIYANPQWRKSLRQDPKILMNPYGYGSLSIYLLFLSILHLFQCLLVVIMDLDTPWDTGLLACNGLICPLFHCLWTGNRLAIVMITITLGIEALVLLQKETNFPSNILLRWIIADGNSRKSIRIAVGVTLLAYIYGLIETAYWRVQYYNSEYEKQSYPGFLGSPSSMSSVPEPLARCEVAGGFQYWFATKPVNRYDHLVEIDVRRRAAELAASYFDYQWITGITVDCALALGNVCIGLAIVRAYFMEDLIIRPRYAESRAIASRINHLEVLHIATISIIQGLFRLPSALFTMLDPLTRPGEMTLTDAEVSKDPTWQRFFLMLSAKVVGIELGNLPAALLMPICIGLCQEFRQNLYGLIQFKTPAKLRTTLTSLNPRHGMSRIITPPLNRSDNFKKDAYMKGSKRYSPNDISYESKFHQSEMPHHLRPSDFHDRRTVDTLEELSSERYVPNNQQCDKHNFEVHSETDGETTYDNTKSFHHCPNHHNHLNDMKSTDQCQTIFTTVKQNSPYTKPKRYEKLNDIHHQQRYHSRYLCKSDWDLHNSIPNSLFCSNNQLTNQLYCKSIDFEEIKQVEQPRTAILEHRSYV
ncbi:unnamed protein product [Heterobilharzia americana]|nr:unnamed protein product [Heterobilharzia americana]